MLLWAVLAVAGGAMLPLQAAINARLGERVGSPLWAAAISGAVLCAALACACLAVLRGPPRLAELASAPAWMWAGGLCGGFLLAVSIAATPRLGSAAMVACVVAGQLACSLALDHFGQLGLPEHPLNAWRLAGAALLAAGVVLVRFV